MRNFITILSLISILISGEIKDRTIKTIKSFYGTEIDIDSKKFKIPKKIKSKIQNHVKQKFFRDEIYYWVIKESEKIKGYALLDNSKGKSMPITYLVIFNTEQDIVHSSIIKYREGYGGEVKSRSWLDQFNGMKNDSLYSYPRNIAGISGATISVKSVTKGFAKLSLLLPYIIKDANKNEN